MKAPRFLWRLFFALLLCNVHAFGQNENPLLSMEVIANPIRNNLSSDSLPLISDSTIYQVTMNLRLYDSTNIQNIEIKIGSSDGGSEFLSHTFSFDVYGTLGSGMSYARNGNTLQLGLGELSGLYSYYAEVRVQHLDGTYSPSIPFNK